jgi:hypothetical protein
MSVPGLSGQYASMPHEYPRDTGGYHPEHAHGWLRFAAIMLGIVGVLNVVYGIAALGDSQVFVHSPKYVAINSLHAWGWLFIIIGAIQLSAAPSIWRGGMYGAVVGVVSAGLNMLGSLFAVRAHPLWSLTVFAVDVLVIYAVAVYGGRGSRTDTG